jgi:TonB family protein
MSLESRQVSGEGLGSLQSCLVEGDPQQRIRERGARRRALAISIATQSVILAALVLIPLLGKPVRIALANVVPLPPYYAQPAARHAADPAQPHPARPRNVCRFCAPTSIPPTIPTVESDPPDDNGDGVPILDGPALLGTIPMPDGRDGLRPPPPHQTHAETPHIVHTTHIDPALLTRRVEPIYPTLAKQLGKSGRVELRAIIATDGTIQSLQVVEGDPLFYQSAMDAVRQWRYTPTILNGQAVEVDTYITVIYNIAR